MALVGRYFVLGSTAFPTFLYYWYKFLDVRMVSKTPAGIVAKVVVDQMVTAPPILATFYIGKNTENSLSVSSLSACQIRDTTK